MGATNGALFGVLKFKSHWGPLHAATALGLAAKTSAYSFRASIMAPSLKVRADRYWPHPVCPVGLTRGSRPVSPGHLELYSCPWREIGDGASRETGSAECQSCSHGTQWLHQLPWRWRSVWWPHWRPYIWAGCPVPTTKSRGELRYQLPA